MKTSTGLDRLANDPGITQRFKGRVAYLCHNASVDGKLRSGVHMMASLFGARLQGLFSPQHGLFSDVQDNMLESGHFVHPLFKIPVHSLYSETRMPTEAMLEGMNTIFIDLQEVGCRAYTYVSTLILMMRACARKDIRLVVLDRPNPLGGLRLEGNVLDPAFASYIGMLPIPMRHGMTIGELALLAQKLENLEVDLEIIPMQGWHRRMGFKETGLPWVLPSPNMPDLETASVFPGTVIFEGTSLSEGRGTTRPFELFGHPELEPFQHLARFESVFKAAGIEGCTLRPTAFQPTFEKHQGRLCGAYQLHITDGASFQPWKTGQLICREMYQVLGPSFEWRQPPFEYEYEMLPIDMLNGTDRLRHWVENYGHFEELPEIEQTGMEAFLENREEVNLYRGSL